MERRTGRKTNREIGANERIDKLYYFEGTNKTIRMKSTKQHNCGLYKRTDITNESTNGKTKRSIIAERRTRGKNKRK